MKPTEKELIQAKHRMEVAQTRNRSKDKKARTHRLIQDGAILRSVFPQVIQMSTDEVEDFLRGWNAEYGATGDVSGRTRSVPLLFPSQSS